MKSLSAMLTAGFLVFVASTSGCSRHSDEVTGDLVYTIEAGGVHCGYAVVDTSLTIENGQESILLERRSLIQAELMGSGVNTESRSRVLLNRTDKQVRRFEGEVSMGPQTSHWDIAFADGQAIGSSSLKRDHMTLDLPPDVLVESGFFFEHVVADFAGTALEEKTYRVFDPIDFEIRQTRYEKRAEETLELDGLEYPVVVVDRVVQAIGTRTRLWIDTRTTMVVKYDELDGVVLTLTQSPNVDRVERVNMDPVIFNRTNAAIADVAGITYMKVRATMRPIGLEPTTATLNVPGQTFTGTVNDNLIEGVFEIEHPRFDGTDAPVFPAEEPAPELAEYLAADGVFEADDEVLVAKAREITTGATDAWDAATRLAKWVAVEIGYAIPGGGRARRTYDIRAGECGAHSILLATFCRAVGIPARMVWGCMYTTNQGGSFGQHAWTEVHMGRAGWIPLDATVGEFDGVDSGHIRVGSFDSVVLRLNAREFDILECRLAHGDSVSTAVAAERYARYLGTYQRPASSSACELEILDGRLVLGLPDNTKLVLDDPDDRGRWMCKMATQVFVTVADTPAEDAGDVKAFTLHQLFSLPRQEGVDASESGAPAGLQPYLGSYHLAALAADFRVSWQRDRLVLKHPRRDRSFRLEPAGEEGTWKTQDGPYTVSFVTDEDGNVASMTLETADVFRRQ